MLKPLRTNMQKCSCLLLSSIAIPSNYSVFLGCSSSLLFKLPKIRNKIETSQSYGLCHLPCYVAISSKEASTEVEVDVEVAEGYTMTQFCDKIIDVFLYEKTRTKEWKRFLIFRDEWGKYKDRFYLRCHDRADMERDPSLKNKLLTLSSKVKRIDKEMEENFDLLREIQDSPTDLNAVVARRRKDFTGDFFRFLALVSETSESLEDQDALARLGTRCLSSINTFDKTLESMDELDVTQAKLDEILDSPSVEAACEKIKSMAKSKQLDSSLILLINSTWAAAKESKSIKIEVKDIMYRLYKATKSSLRSIAPKEVKLLKHLLNITDPEERFSALATAFAPGDEHESKGRDELFTTPKELHKWIKIMLDSYHLNKEETDIREARQLSDPMVIQRLIILKDTIEEEYLEKPPTQRQTEVDDPESLD